VARKKFEVMSGNGVRAARREKHLSKPLESGQSIWADSTAFMRRLAHHINRQVVRSQLAEAISSFREDLRGVAVSTPDKRGDWMVERASRCGCVHAAPHRLYFNN
jgi:hypothetical protein